MQGLGIRDQGSGSGIRMDQGAGKSGMVGQGSAISELKWGLGSLWIKRTGEAVDNAADLVNLRLELQSIHRLDITAAGSEFTLGIEFRM